MHTLLLPLSHKDEHALAYLPTRRHLIVSCKDEAPFPHAPHPFPAPTHSRALGSALASLPLSHRCALHGGR